MYEYSIFWIKEEIANNYFHKSDLLYRFIYAYQRNHRRPDLRNQFNYITNSFSVNDLVTYLETCRDFGFSRSEKIVINGDMVEFYLEDKYISLHIKEKQLQFVCKTLQDAEDLLFPLLRRFDNKLFVVGNNHLKFGWISPIQQLNVSLSGHVLYSYQ
ncbi:sporulation inhibitor of replication protein SirA [Virgibacillus xinjiangensis]|uniref:Sporulation inhibitor of replication protein SirA n=1 Tax=Virgibacillus xinjiangensis TaxID=393090 RepID=A0ABV7CR03_9BACI